MKLINGKYRISKRGKVWYVSDGYGLMMGREDGLTSEKQAILYCNNISYYNRIKEGISHMENEMLTETANGNLQLALDIKRSISVAHKELGRLMECNKHNPFDSFRDFTLPRWYIGNNIKKAFCYATIEVKSSGYILK